MRVYEYSVLLDDIVLDTGEKHASDDVSIEGRIKNEVLKKYPHATNWTFKQLQCDDCQDGENDVTAYYVQGDKRVVKCNSCRLKEVMKAKEGKRCRKPFLVT